MRHLALCALAACGTDPALERGAIASHYRNVASLFDQGIARTCSLNNGVCHNSNTYPDLHTIDNLVAAIGMPCNVDRTDRTMVNDVCEPPADHLVVPSQGIDVRIASAMLDPAQATVDVSMLTSVTLSIAPLPAGLAAPAGDLEVHRGSEVFALGDAGATVASVTGSTVKLDLSHAMLDAKQFFDVRVYPPGPSRVHEGDPNHDGVEGALAGAMPMIAAGDPAGSYLVHRLTDTNFGELMPRQCRTWDDDANQALVCWISGLLPDGSNAYDAIDYDACAMRVAGLGKCGQP